MIAFHGTVSGIYVRLKDHTWIFVWEGNAISKSVSAPRRYPNGIDLTRPYTGAITLNVSETEMEQQP